MTARVREPAAASAPPPVRLGGAARKSRSRWLVPGLLIAALVGVLLVADVVALSTVVYAGLMAGMLLMHTGHGHGGHGDQTEAADGLSASSPASQPRDAASAAGLDGVVPHDSPQDATEDHDRKTSHGCH